MSIDDDNRNGKPERARLAQRSSRACMLTSVQARLSCPTTSAPMTMTVPGNSMRSTISFAPCAPMS